MKVITLYQPWAILIRDGRKLIETRSWTTKHRGILGIHAGKTVDTRACETFGYDPYTVPTGAILCTVNLYDVIEFPSNKVVPDLYGDYSHGRFGWMLKDVKVLEPPIPAKGQMGLWNWDDGKQLTLF